MQVLPATTLATITETFGETLAANAVVIVGVIALAVGITFVVRWFNKGTKRIKA